MKTKFKSISLIATSALIISMPVVSLSCSGDNTNDKNTFDIGTDASFAPYNFAVSTQQYNKIHEESLLELDNPSTTDITPDLARKYLEAIAPVDSKNGYVGGYDIYVANKVAKSLGETTVAHIIPFPQLIPTMRDTGSIDAIAADMSDTQARREDVNFTLPYNKPKNVILYNKNNTRDFILDTSGNPIATNSSTVLASRTETTWFDIASSIPHSGEVIEMETTSLLEDKIINLDPTNMIDGILYEESRAKLVANEHPDRIGIFGADNLEYQSKPEDEIAMALPKTHYYSTIEGIERMRTINTAIMEMMPSDWDENMDTCIELAKYVGAA